MWKVHVLNKGIYAKAGGAHRASSSYYSLSSSFETGHLTEPRTKLAASEPQGLVCPCRPHHQGCSHACGHA